MRDGRSVGRSVGWTFDRTLVSPSVGGKGEAVGRMGGQSNRFEWQPHGPTADGRTYRRWKREAVRRTVLATDGRAVPRSTVGRADSQQDGRKNGRADGRSHEVGHDQSQGSRADRTPDRAIGKSKER